MGLMKDSVSLDPAASGLAPEPPQGPQTSATPARGGADADEPNDADIEQMFGKPEMDESVYDDMVDRGLLAAFKVLSTPQMMQEQAQLLANPTGEALGSFVFDLLTGLQEKAQGKIQDEAMPGILFGVLTQLGEAGEVPAPILIEAVQRSMTKFLVKSGADPKEIEAAMGSMDFNAIAQAAQGAADGQPQ